MSQLSPAPTQLPDGSEAEEAHPFITIAEAARILGFSHMTIRRAIAARKFPAVKIGTKSLVMRAFVEEIVDRAAGGETVFVEELGQRRVREAAQRTR